MTGLAYKELKQNLKLILGALVLPGLIAFPGCAWVIYEAGKYPEGGAQALTLWEQIGTGSGIDLWIGAMGLAFLVTGFLQGAAFRGDDRKVWAGFIASTPQGIRGYLKAKYELIFVMTLLTLFSVMMGDWIMGMVCASHGVMWMSLAQVMMILSYVQLALRGLEMPFIIRFGVKNGSIIKSILLALFGIVLLAVFALWGEELASLLTGWDTGELSALAEYPLALLPVIAGVLYYLSYRLSCRLYMKGAELYDK